MEIKTVKLGEIAEFANGLNFDKSAYRAGVKIIGVSDFKDYSIPIIDSLAEVAIDAVKESARLKENDIIFVRSNGNKDLVGRCMIIPHTSEKLYFSGFCIRCRFKNTIYANPRYFLYLFKSPSFKRQLSNTSVGANIQNLSQSRLAMASVPLPTKEVQDKIASILSAYDDMIDNCKAQIALLEEAAQRLFREWFVLGNVSQIDWIEIPVTSVYDINYGKTLATKFIQKSGKYPVYGSSKCIGYYSKKTVDDYKVLITSRGNAGKVHRTLHKESFVTNNSFVVTPKAEFSYIPFSYIYYSFLAMDLQRIVNGSAQQQLTNAMLENVMIFLPDKDTLSKFGELSDKYISEINTLHDIISFCNEAKSSLLPRLISGQIEIKV